MKKILIIGAGISGLYLANLLEKNGNYDYKILEKKKVFNLQEGYGIQLSVNGVKLLNEIGFREIAIHDINYPRNINFLFFFYKLPFICTYISFCINRTT